MDMKIRGKVALVTGAGQGMGKGIGMALAEEGVHVCVNDVVKEKALAAVEEISAKGVDTLALPGDVASYPDVKACVEKALQKFGRIDILVNCAGIGDSGKFIDTREQEWQKVLGVCLMGTIYFTKEVLPGMMEKKWGRIINIVSDAGRIGEPGLVVYSAAKAGIIGFSKALAKEVGKYSITVNCVSPGATLTDHIQEIYEKMKAQMGEEKFAERQKKVLKRYPLSLHSPSRIPQKK